MIENHPSNQVSVSRFSRWMQVYKDWCLRQGNTRMAVYFAGLFVLLGGLYLLAQSKTQTEFLSGVVVLCIVTFIVAWSALCFKTTGK